MIEQMTNDYKYFKNWNNRIVCHVLKEGERVENCNSQC